MAESEAATAMVAVRSGIRQEIDLRPVGDRGERRRRVVCPDCGRTIRWSGPARHPSRRPEGVPSPNQASPKAGRAFGPRVAVRCSEALEASPVRSPKTSPNPGFFTIDGHGGPTWRTRPRRRIRPRNPEGKHPCSHFGEVIPVLIAFWCRRFPPLVGATPLTKLVSREPFLTSVHGDSLRSRLQGRLPVAVRSVLEPGPSLPAAGLLRIPAENLASAGPAACWPASWPSSLSQSASKTLRNPGHSWPPASELPGLELERKRAKIRGEAGEARHRSYETPVSSRSDLRKTVHGRPGRPDSSRTLPCGASRVPATCARASGPPVRLSPLWGERRSKTLMCAITKEGMGRFPDREAGIALTRHGGHPRPTRSGTPPASKSSGGSGTRLETNSSSADRGSVLHVRRSVGSSPGCWPPTESRLDRPRWSDLPIRFYLRLRPPRICPHCCWAELSTGWLHKRTTSMGDAENRRRGFETTRQGGTDRVSWRVLECWAQSPSNSPRRSMCP